MNDRHIDGEMSKRVKSVDWSGRRVEGLTEVDGIESGEVEAAQSEKKIITGIKKGGIAGNWRVRKME